MKYVELYADADGESHFRDVEIDPETTTLPLQGDQWIANGGFRVIRRPAGRTSDFHRSPERLFGPFLAGVIEFRASDGEVRRFTTGDLFLSGDTTGKGHTTAAIGDADAWYLCIRLDP